MRKIKKANNGSIWPRIMSNVLLNVYILTNSVRVKTHRQRGVVGRSLAWRSGAWRGVVWPGIVFKTKP